MTGSTVSASMGRAGQERRGWERALLPLVSQQCPGSPMHTTKGSSMTIHIGARVRAATTTLSKQASSLWGTAQQLSSNQRQQQRLPSPLGVPVGLFAPSQPLSTATLATAAAVVSFSGSYSRTSTSSSARGCLGMPTYTGLGRFPCPQACSCHVTAPPSRCGRVTCPPQIPMLICTGHTHSTCS